MTNMYNIRNIQKIAVIQRVYWMIVKRAYHKTSAFIQTTTTRCYPLICNNYFKSTSNFTSKFPECSSVCVWTSHQPRRHLWRMLSMVFNRPDKERIKEVGAERACAEWLLRCGAHIKWEGSKSWQTDYNLLPPGNFKKYKIEEINADDAAVMYVGFAHLKGVTSLKKIRFHHCAYLEDDAIAQLALVKDSLEHLEISSCDVSDQGLMSLTCLTNLKTLLLYDLPEVRNKREAIDKLQKALPNCEIEFKDIESIKK